MSRRRGWLIYSKEDYERNSSFARRFLDLGNSAESSISLVFKEDIHYGIRDNQLCIFGLDGADLPSPDFVINRSIDPLLSRHLEGMGVRVFNSADISEICNDKARTYFKVSHLNIPMVDTLFVDRKALTKGEFPFDYPVVVKTVEGRGGKEVFLVNSVGEINQIVNNIPSGRFVVQKLCGCPGRDVRVFVVGKNIVGSIIRISNGDFKANFSLGGTARAYSLNEAERESVMRIVNSFDFGMVGIDFVFDEKGSFLFNEIEDVAGSRTLSMTSDVDIVKLYLEHIFKSFVSD